MNLMLAQSQAQPWLDLLAAGGITVVGVLLVVVVAFTKCLEVWNSRRFTLGVFSDIILPQRPLHRGRKEVEGEQKHEKEIRHPLRGRFVSRSGVSIRRDRVRRGAQQKVQEGKQKVEKKAQEAKQEVGKEAREAKQEVGKEVQQGEQSGAKESVGKKIQVKETEFRLKPAEITLEKPGTYVFKAVNSGETVHALEVEGQGIEEETAEIQPAQSAELKVKLEAGTYELYCPVDGHKEEGMEGKVIVKEGSGGPDGY